jgi:hypothetical protein
MHATAIGRLDEPLRPVIAEPRTRWPRQENHGGPGPGRKGPIPISVKTRDPISEFGVLAQLRHQPEVVVAEPGERPVVLVAILDSTDEDAVRWLKALHADGGLPIVLTIRFASPTDIARVGLLSGEPGGDYTTQARPRTIELIAGTAPPVTLSFEDTPAFQDRAVNLTDVAVITVVIKNAYPGQQGQSVALREIEFFSKV